MATLSAIEAIRAAQAQLPILEEQLATLRKEAMEDGTIDLTEQAEIERVEGKITNARTVITDQMNIWQSNKSAFEARRAALDPDLAEVTDTVNEALTRDQRAISDALAAVDRAVAAENFASALELMAPLETLVANFLSLKTQMAETAELDAMTPEELADADLTTDMLDEVFTEEYMSDLATMEFKGEGDADLKKIMADIEKGLASSAVDETMEKLAGIVGIPPSAADLKGDHARFLVIRKQQEAIGSEKGNPEVDGLDEDKHPDFRASRSQLMFGKVLGDSFGIHEVFAALLSPTGGLIGPGNSLDPFGLIDSPDAAPDHPIALHGTVHDAAGYLKAYHDDGPGYNYLGNEWEAAATEAIEDLPDFIPDDIQKTIKDIALPLTGQVSGAIWWTMEAGDEYVQTRCDEALVILEAELENARDATAREIEAMIQQVEDTRDVALETVEDVQREVEEAIDTAEEQVREAAEAVQEQIEDAVETAEEELREAAEVVQDQVGDAMDAAEAQLQEATATVETEVVETIDAIGEGVESAANAAVETYDTLEAGACAIGEAASEKLDALASFIWS